MALDIPGAKRTNTVIPPSPFDDDGAADVPDFGQLLLKITGGGYEATAQKPAVLQDLGLSLEKPQALSLDSLTTRAPGVESWRTAFAPMPEYKPMDFQWEYNGQKVSGPPQTPTGGSYGGRPKGGFGPGAYGFTGTTGLKGSKGSSPYGFQTKMWNALQALNSAAAAQGLGRFSITDGWRSYDAQVALKAKKGDLAATPGRSVHGLGLAADIGYKSAKQKAWIHRNAAKFGLVFLPSEDWHVQLMPAIWKGGKK